MAEFKPNPLIANETKPYWETWNQQWTCPNCGAIRYGTAALCDCIADIINVITNDTPMKKDFKLCYIYNNFAYFTTQDLEKQWGDDWNDAPYEHNSGIPYEPAIRHYVDGRTEKSETDWNEDGSPKWEIYKVAYDTRFHTETPADMACNNSRYSVQMINNKLTPWLTKYPNKALFAGASIDEFVTFVEECGGTVYFPKEKNNGTA